MAIEIKNALITRTTLGIEDHGILTFMLDLDYGGSGQGAGGISLDGGDPRTYASTKFIRDILETVGVDTWEKLPRTHIRVKADMNKVYEIGNILKDKWLRFEDSFKEA